jgi:hypothetical protein
MASITPTNDRLCLEECVKSGEDSTAGSLSSITEKFEKMSINDEKYELLLSKICRFVDRTSFIQKIREFDKRAKDKSAIDKMVSSRKKQQDDGIDFVPYYTYFGLELYSSIYAEALTKYLSMLEGNLWQDLLGLVDFKTETGTHIKITNLGIGHISSCDLLIEFTYADGTTRKCYVELKNRTNTMNSSSAKETVAKLVKLYEDKFEVCLMFIHRNNKKSLPRFKAPDFINVVGGGSDICKFIGIYPDFVSDICRFIELFTTHS